MTKQPFFLNHQRGCVRVRQATLRLGAAAGTLLQVSAMCYLLDGKPLSSVGLIWSTNTARSAPEAERKTLRDLRFQTGDFIDCAIHFPKINGPGGQYVGPWGQLEPPESPGADASSPT